MEKVTIILPAYNAEKTIKTAIQSVLNQTYENIELIIINNGSKDSTEAIIEKYKQENSDKINYIYTEIANVSNARNIGIDNAKGKYLTFIDADDEFETQFIENMLANITTTNSELVTCAYRTIHNKKIWDLKEYKEIENTNDIKKYLELLKENYLFNELWNKLYITEIIKENKIYFDQEYELGEDFIFNIDYIRNIERVSYINDALYIYTDGQNGLNLKYRKNKFQIEYELTKYLEKFYKEKDFDLEYIYNRFARIYYNEITNIYKHNNKATRKGKNMLLKKFIDSEEYKNDMEILKNKVTDRKFKIAINYFFTKGATAIKFFVLLNKLRRS